MLRRRAVRFRCFCGASRLAELSGREALNRFAGGLVAFLKIGNLLWNIVFLNNEVFPAKALDIVSFMIRNGHVELHQNDVDA